jgi:guanine deaminase
MSDREFIKLALAKAREGIAEGQTPFGACIARDGKVISAAHNTVWQETDSTAHAEINAIRVACRALGTIDRTGCSIYSTCEPCPMCFAAIHWARIDRVIYGATIADAQAAGFHELAISNREMKERGGSAVVIESGLMFEECRALFTEWLERKDKSVY